MNKGEQEGGESRLGRSLTLARMTEQNRMKREPVVTTGQRTEKTGIGYVTWLSQRYVSNSQVGCEDVNGRKDTNLLD